MIRNATARRHVHLRAYDVSVLASPQERWTLPMERPELRTERVRRAINVAAAALGLILSAPLMLLIALLVKLSSPGPIIYGQVRVGIDRRRPGSTHSGRRQHDYGGKLFTLYKFRTMRVQAADAPQVWAKKDDPRVTPIGAVLRKLRLDELPQLWNVLRGEMNLVGPRPEQPQIFARIRQELRGYARRQCVLPGLTGLAQVELPYDGSIDDVRRKLELDLRYVARTSPLQDLSIMVRTIPVMFWGKGAQ